jgi:Rrf2 family protein
MANTRYSTALHILVLLSADKDAHHTSASIAEQLGTNPVVIRRLVSDLAKAGLVSARRGAGGGVSLGTNPAETSLGQIADIVEYDLTFDSHDLPVRDGRSHLPGAILSAIEAQRRELHTASVVELDRVTLQDLTHAATVRAGLAELVGQGMSNADIRNGYRIENGRLIPRDDR